MKPANLNDRFIAFIIDLIILYSTGLGILISLSLQIKFINLALTVVPISILYFFFMWRLNNGRSLGMLFKKIRVSMEDETSLDNNKLFLRAMLLTIVVAPFHAIIILTIFNFIMSYNLLKNKKENLLKQTLWDKATNTAVVQDLPLPAN